MGRVCISGFGKILVGFCLGSIMLVSCKEKKAEELVATSTTSNIVNLTPVQMATITLDTAKLENEKCELALVGEISFDEDKVTKVYPLQGGDVVKVNVGLGDYVQKGQVLCEIKSSGISDLQSDYAIAQNDLQVAKKNLDIANELYKSKVNSLEQFLVAQNDFDRSTAEVNKLKQELAIYGTGENGQDAQYNLTSPITGYIVEKNINENMKVRTDNTSNLFTVCELNSIWALADIYESDLSKVALNDSVEITTIAYPDKIFGGKITRIGNVLDPQSKLVKARIELNNADNLLRPEMFIALKVHLQQQGKAVAVKSNAVVFLDGSNYVMVYRKNQSFEKKLVSVGYSIDDKTYIMKGLSPGDVVVGDGSLFVASIE